MRAVLALTALALVAVAGCFDSTRQDAAPGDDSPPNGLDMACGADGDCVAAGASCCGCPEYAVNAASDFAQACEDVDCPAPDPGTCSNLVPTCSDQGQCVLACAPVSCDQQCEFGFSPDAAGCLTCECMSGGVPAECTTDDTCARVPADCCGCAMGGADTAIPSDQVGVHEAGLDCPSRPVCPGVDVCEPGAIARCEMGRCVLSAEPSPGTLPAGACGTPELPPCPTGQTCVLNSDGDATMQGVGVCQ